MSGFKFALASLLVAASIFTDFATASAQTKVSPARATSCHNRAVAAIDTAARREKEFGQAIVAQVLFGLVGLAIVSIANSEDRDTAVAALEKACLQGKDISIKAAQLNAITPVGAKATCNNAARTCKGAFASCMRSCDTQNLGGGCRAECQQAGDSCSDTGAFRTATCSKTGLKP